MDGKEIFLCWLLMLAVSEGVDETVIACQDCIRLGLKWNSDLRQCLSFCEGSCFDNCFFDKEYVTPSQSIKSRGIIPAHSASVMPFLKSSNPAETPPTGSPTAWQPVPPRLLSNKLPTKSPIAKVSKALTQSHTTESPMAGRASLQLPQRKPIIGSLSWLNPSTDPSEALTTVTPTTKQPAGVLTPLPSFKTPSWPAKTINPNRTPTQQLPTIGPSTEEFSRTTNRNLLIGSSTDSSTESPTWRPTRNPSEQATFSPTTRPTSVPPLVPTKVDTSWVKNSFVWLGIGILIVFFIIAGTMMCRMERKVTWTTIKRSIKRRTTNQELYESFLHNPDDPLVIRKAYLSHISEGDERLASPTSTTTRSYTDGLFGFGRELTHSNQLMPAPNLSSRRASGSAEVSLTRVAEETSGFS